MVPFVPMSGSLRVALVAVLSGFFGGPAEAQTVGGDGAAVLSDGRPMPVAPAVIARNERGVTVRATRITTPMTIDGRLDEAVYSQVPPSPSSSSRNRTTARGVTESTTAWVFFDDDNFYVACRCLMADLSQIVANDMRRDSSNLRQNDNFGVFLDTFHDRRNGYLFYVSPVGGMFDGATANERTNNADWNTIWDAQGVALGGGWNAEIAIPFKSLRYQPGREQKWGINLRRTIRGKNEYAYVAPIRPEWGVGGFFRASAAATLVGLEVPTAGKNLEIKPYAASRLTTDTLVSPPSATTVDNDVGVDIKYGVTKSLTADFTYNTDFAQVEVDEAQVNLTRFNLQFPEKRDFFLEGQGIFTFGGPRGARRRRCADAVLQPAHRPAGQHRRSRSDVGARLAGRVGRYSIGALNIGTEETTSAERGRHQLHRAAREARRAAAQLDWRALHEPFGLDRVAWQQPGVRRRCQLRPVPEHQPRRLPARVADRRPDGRCAQLSRQLQLRRRPLRRQSIAPSSATTSIRKWVPAAHAVSQQLRVACGSAPGRRRNATIRQYFYEAASTTSPTTRTRSNREL